MAKVQTQFSTTVMGAEKGNNSNNNVFQTTVEKGFDGDNIANGMGIAKPANLKTFENVPGSEASEQYNLKMREMARYNMISNAFGNPEINNAGIVLPMVDVGFGESAGKFGSKPDIQGGANR